MYFSRCSKLNGIPPREGPAQYRRVWPGQRPPRSPRGEGLDLPSLAGDAEHAAVFGGRGAWRVHGGRGESFRACREGIHDEFQGPGAGRVKVIGLFVAAVDESVPPATGDDSEVSGVQAFEFLEARERCTFEGIERFWTGDRARGGKKEGVKGGSFQWVVLPGPRLMTSDHSECGTRSFFQNMLPSLLCCPKGPLRLALML